MSHHTFCWYQYLCVHMFLVRVRALSECRIKLGIGLLTPERPLIHYKYSKQNTPEGEDFCSGDLLQLLLAQPTLLIKGLWSQPQSTLPQGPQAQWASGGHWRTVWGNGAYWLCHTVGHCFYPTELCLFIGPQHQGLLVTQIKGQLRHWNSREIKVHYWWRSHSGGLSTFIKQQWSGLIGTWPMKIHHTVPYYFQVKQRVDCFKIG